MKTPGVSINPYPARYTFIDKHTLIPFGSIIKNYHYYLFWARCGIRKKNQIGKSSKEVALKNTKFAQNYLNYLNPKVMLKKAKVYFPSVRFIPETWHYPQRFLHCFLKIPLIKLIHTYTNKTILLLEKY